MNPTTTGRFRVFDGPDDDRWLFVDVGDPDAPVDPEDAYAPTYVPKTGHGDLDETVAALRPGYLVAATIEFDDGTPRVVDVEIERRSLFDFVDGATNIFEAAQQTWAAAVTANDPMNSRVTYDTDGQPNGVLYVFAQQPGAQDLFEEFASGVRPLEPLIERVDEGQIDAESSEEDPETGGSSGEVSLGPGGNLVVDADEAGDGDDGTETGDESGPPEREVFVIRPKDDPYVMVYIVLQKGSLLADTMRDTYHCPRPEESV